MLVVEDDLDDKEFIQEALAACGFQDAAAFLADGVQALAAMQGSRSLSRVPSLVVLDLMLPKLSGLEVLERLRAQPRTKSVPVVIFSSSDRPEDVARAYALGVNGYVRKPVDPSDFAAAVADMARYWLARNITADALR